MAVTLLGNGPELHDRLVGQSGAFAELEPQVPRAERIIVAVRRANAFHAQAIVEYAVNKRGGTPVVAPFDPHPVETMAGRWRTHLDELQAAGRPFGVEVEVADPQLTPLFAHVAERADGQNETELLRVLGVVCDTALVGPHWFVFEIINRCNLHCRYCNIHAPACRPGPEFLEQRLSFATYRAVVADLARLGTDGVTILANGEPTLHPDFARMIETAAGLGLRGNFFTNGLLLDEAATRTIVSPQVDEMFCTISAATPATYLALHADAGAADWEKLLANLRRLFARRRAAGHGKPFAWMVNVICGPNAAELPAMAELAADLGFDGLRPQLLRVDEANRDLALCAADVARLRESRPRLEERCRKLGIKLWEPFAFQLAHAGDNPDEWSGNEFVEKGCFIGWSLALAKANGDLSFCCTVKPVANLTEGPFADLWATGLYQRARLAAKDLRWAGDLALRDGGRLFTEACRHCDNHDINRRMHELMDRYDMWRWLA